MLDIAIDTRTHTHTFIVAESKSPKTKRLRTRTGNKKKIELLDPLKIAYFECSGTSDEYSMSGWNEKKGDQNNFLIHVTPPADSYTQAVRELSIKMDLATAGILYDKTVCE